MRGRHGFHPNADEGESPDDPGENKALDEQAGTGSGGKDAGELSSQELSAKPASDLTVKTGSESMDSSFTHSGNSTTYTWICIVIIVTTISTCSPRSAFKP